MPKKNKSNKKESDSNKNESDESNKNESDDIDLPGWLTLISETLNKSRKKTFDILTKKYHFKKEDALIAEESVHTSTLAAMRQTYHDIKFEQLIPAEEVGEIEKIDLSRVSRNYPDLRIWILTTMRVPYYQSLGDTLGYYNGNFEFNFGNVRPGPDYVNEMIYDFISFGGINDISLQNWKASDDTVLYMATLEVLASMPSGDIDINTFGEKLRIAYLAAKPVIMDRHPGQITKDSLAIQENIQWDKLPYNNGAKGNGSVMRCGCIGIFFPGKHNRANLVALAIESSRITHNSTIANLGSVVAALFTAYGLEKVPINLWIHKLLKLLRSDLIDSYMKTNRPTEYPLYRRDRGNFIGQWEKYLHDRFSGINVRTDRKWMKNPVLRYKYLSENFSKGCEIPGGCADDSVIMAYDALLESGNVFEKVVVYSTLHPGDSDTVGSIALSWYGALYHSVRNEMLLDNRFEQLEFNDKLYDISLSIRNRLTEIYYYDIYLNTATKYLREIVKY